MLGDLLGSAAAILAALIILFTGWTQADPLLSMLVCLLLLGSAWKLVRRSGLILLEAAPPHIDRNAVADDIVRNVAGVEDIHHMHVWSLDGRQLLATLHVRLTAGSDAGATIEAVKARLNGARDQPRDGATGNGPGVPGREEGGSVDGTAGRQARISDGGGPGHRPRDGGGVRARGAEVIATDVDMAKLAGLETAGAARLEALNVLDTAAVDALAASVGPIDILFNCAGYVHHGTVLECSEKDWDFSFDLNVKSMHRTIRAFLPGMLERAAARGKSRLHRQRRVRRLVGARHPQPLRLRARARRR